MRVNVKFTEDFSRNLNIDLVKELIGMHKQVLIRKYGKIPEEKQQIFENLLEQLEVAKPNELVDFTVLGDIHFEKQEGENSDNVN